MAANAAARRVLRSFTAHLSGHGINVIQQILMIPLFASVWGIEVYGEWMVLSSVPVYLSMSDLGLGRAAATKLALIAGLENRDEANEIYNTSLAGMLAMCGMFALIAPLFCMLVPVENWFNLRHLSPHEIKLSMVLLIWGVMFQIACGGALAIFCWDGLQATGAALNTAQRGVELIAAIAVLFLHQPPWVMALTIASVRLLCVLVVAFIVRVKLPWVRLSRKLVCWRNLHGLIAPSIGSMVAPFAMSVNLQGTILVVGILFGPEYVVILNATRVVTRALLHWTDAIKRAVRPEISVAYGKHDLPLTARLYMKACRVGFWSTLAWSVLVCALAPTIINLLLRGKVPFNAPLFYSLVAVVLFNSAWSLSSLVLEATNDVFRLSMVCLAVYSLSVGLSYLFMRNYGFSAAAYGSLAAEVLLTFIVLNMSLKMLGEQRSVFAQYLVCG